MNEEEKEAIDWLKDELDDEKKSHKNCNYSYKGVTGLYGNNEVEIALKLIDKQQREIEELKENNKDLDEQNFKYTIKIASLQTDVQETTNWIHKNWKDKIKELIKEKAKTDTYNFTTIAVKDIEELLGE